MRRNHDISYAREMVWMSRSRKKVGVLKDNDGAGRKSSWKKIANRAWRRTTRNDMDVPDAAKWRYRQIDPCDVVDFKFYADGDEDDLYKWYAK